MSFVLELSGNESVLRADYFPPIILEEDHEIALLSFQGWNSVANLTAQNNKFYYTVGKKLETIAIEPGSYEIVDIEKFLQRAMRAEHLKHPLKPEQKQDLAEEAILLSGNNSTFKTEIVCRDMIRDRFLKTSEYRASFRIRQETKMRTFQEMLQPRFD